MLKPLSAFLVLVVAAWGIAAPAAAAPISIMKLMAPGPLPDMTLGQSTAPVTVVEYAALTCPHCGHFYRNTFDTLKTKYIDTGKVYFVFRDFPLNQLGFAAYMAARCAPKDKFFSIIDTLFRQQDSWAYVNNPEPALVNELKPYGVTQASFAACLKDTKLANSINEVAQTANKDFGVDATPTFFIDGTKHVGDMDAKQLEAILDPLIAKAKN